MLKGKTALVTGSTSGIGLGMAEALAREGANIVLNGFGDIEGPKAKVQALGVKVDWRTYPMPHSVHPQEVRDLGDWMAARFAGD